MLSWVVPNEGSGPLIIVYLPLPYCQDGGGSSPLAVLRWLARLITRFGTLHAPSAIGILVVLKRSSNSDKLS